VGLFQVLQEPNSEALRRGRFGHFGKCFRNLVFGGLDVVQFIYEYFLQRLQLHCVLPLQGLRRQSRETAWTSPWCRARTMMRWLFAAAILVAGVGEG
jgi:hypothetical protein